MQCIHRPVLLFHNCSHLLFGCGKAASQLAHARLNWGARVHENVIGPMKRVVDATGPNSEMARTRRQAWRAGGELRSVSERAARAASSLASFQGLSVDGTRSPEAEASCSWLVYIYPIVTYLPPKFLRFS